jgi:glycosyltransferase involved in cell wall biosynthesis
MSNISFILFSYNEEKRIEYIVRNLAPYGQVFVLDDGSTDRTQEIAERFGARFVRRPSDPESKLAETQLMLDFVKSIIYTDWIFWGYTDNFLPKTLLDKFMEISKQNRHKYVYVPIDTYLWGETDHPIIRAAYPNFFHKDYVDFTGNRLHGFGKFLGDKGQILRLPWEKKYAICHYSLYNLEKFVTKHLAYAGFEAEDKIGHGLKFRVIYLLMSPARYFYLFYKRGWRAGVRGLYASMLYSFFRLMVAVRLYELENGLDLQTIEAEFAKAKKRIVDDVERGKA